MSIPDHTGYQSLLAAVEAAESNNPGSGAYRQKLAWILDRARHYSFRTGINQGDILDVWERSRGLRCFMEYYSDEEFPEFEGSAVRAFESMEDLQSLLDGADLHIPPPGLRNLGVDVFVKDTMRIVDI